MVKDYCKGLTECSVIKGYLHGIDIIKLINAFISGNQQESYLK